MPRKMIMYLSIKPEICPEYFQNIVFTDIEHELTYTFTSEKFIIPRAEESLHESRGSILHIIHMAFFCNADIVLIFEAVEQPHIFF